MSTKAWQSIIPKKERGYLATVNTLAIGQCLRDLGYWHPEKERTIDNALLLFRTDARKEKLLPVLPASAVVDIREESLLKKLVALEGEFPVLQMPAQGAEGLSVRLLHYRLSLMGLYKGKIEQAFSAKSIQALHQLAQWIQLPPDSPKTLKLTGHLIALIRQVHQKGKLDQRIVTFRFSDKRLPRDLRAEVKVERGIKERKDADKAERSNTKKIRELESKILDPELIARQDLRSRNNNKHKKLQRIDRLLKTIHRQQRRLLQKRLKQRRSKEKRISNSEKKLLIMAASLAEMKATLAHLKELQGAQNKAKAKRLKKQILARQKKLKEKERGLKKEQKELAQLIKIQNKEQAKKQKEFQGLQKQLKTLRSKVNGLRFRFKAALKRSLKSSFYRELQKKAFAQKEQNYLSKIIKTPYNRFLIRLLQLHQWTNGYYNGRIDHRFARKTFMSIAEMVEDIPSLRLKYILAGLDGKNQGYWILNINYLFQHFCHLFPADAPSPKPSKIMSEYQAAFDQKDALIHNSLTEKCLDTWHKEQTNSSKSSTIPRRVYFGQKTLWHSFGRVIGRLGHIIWKGLKTTWQILRNFIRILYEDIRESVILFGQSLDFLFGKRRTLPLGEKETWDMPLYKYDKDLSIEDNALAAQNHFATTAHQSMLPTQAIDQTLKFLKKLVKWVIALATGTMGWPKLLLELVLFFRRWLLRWLKKLLLERRGELIGSSA